MDYQLGNRLERMDNMTEVSIDSQVHKLLAGRTFNTNSIFTLNNLMTFLPKLAGKEDQVSHYLMKMRQRGAIRTIRKNSSDEWEYKLEHKDKLESHIFLPPKENVDQPQETV
jgi:hypothetical protein